MWGNHDEWADVARIRRTLETAGLDVLDNDVTEIPDRGASFWIAGLADYMTRDQKIAATIAKAQGVVIALMGATPPLTGSESNRPVDRFRLR